MGWNLPHCKAHLDIVIHALQQRACDSDAGCLLCSHRHERVSALGISADRCWNEFDCDLSHELDDGGFCPLGFTDPSQKIDLSGRFGPAPSRGIWNWSDTDFLGDLVLDVPAQDIFANLTCCAEFCLTTLQISDWRTMR